MAASAELQATSVAPQPSREGDGPNFAFISLYHANTSMECLVRADPRQCVSYGPLDGEPYANFSVAGYSDGGEALLNGTLVEKWERAEPLDPFFPPLVYELLYVDQRVAGEARPVLAQTLLRPLGVVRALFFFFFFFARVMRKQLRK